jgi:hypothetical protein
MKQLKLFKKDETAELDLEQCVNKNYAQLQPIPECKHCEGYNYNCPSYYTIKQQINESGKYKR